MIERLMGLKGDQGEQGEPGAPAPEEGGGGGGFMSFFKISCNVRYCSICNNTDVACYFAFNRASSW